LPERKILQNIYKAITTATTFNLANTIALLSRTPAALDAFLRGIPDNLDRDSVGPWSIYLGVLQCTGHSAP